MPEEEPSGLRRRGVLGGAGAAVAASAVAPVARAAEALAQPGAARESDFTTGWRFVLANPDGVTDPGGRFADAPKPGFDDSAWQVVDLPHDWSIELPPT